MVDYGRPFIKKETSFAPNKTGKQRSLTENLIEEGLWSCPTGRGCQENRSNYPAVLFINKEGIERTGKREVERNLSSECERVERK